MIWTGIRMVGSKGVESARVISAVRAPAIASTELPVICFRSFATTSGLPFKVASQRSFGTSASATAPGPFSRTSCCMFLRFVTASGESPCDRVSASTMPRKYVVAWRNIANAV